ncbi:CIS tube protein [Aquimarina pacifica]|uniref:CIS tube protein n=1 Tax=Aquimarina pacifica TaxID=1296415 RepID=UPI0004702276|nr:hypothetical protein [Aquimarina pacifica]
MSTGKLQKLVIRCFKDEKFTEELPDLKYTALLNPEKYSFSLTTEFNEEQAQGTSSNDLQFVRSIPEDLDLEFLFDRTGAIVHYGDDPNSSSDDTVYKDNGNGIIDDLDAFKKAAYDYNGDKHKPNYLMVIWGSLTFPCHLVSMDIEYKLFKPDGTPLRALVKAKFKKFIEKEKRSNEQNDQSPDLTHYRIVKAGDTLPLMTFRIYGDPKYYLEVARVNNISNFRKLNVGQELFFPPLQKQS